MTITLGINRAWKQKWGNAVRHRIYPFVRRPQSNLLLRAENKFVPFFDVLYRAAVAESQIRFSSVM